MLLQQHHNDIVSGILEIGNVVAATTQRHSFGHLRKLQYRCSDSTTSVSDILESSNVVVTPPQYHLFSDILESKLSLQRQYNVIVSKILESSNVVAATRQLPCYRHLRKQQYHFSVTSTSFFRTS